MAVKRRKLKYDLSKDDSDWKGCFLLIKTLTVSELQKFQSKASKLDEDKSEDVKTSIQIMTDLLKDKIVGGQVLGDDGVKREYTEDDFDTLLDIQLVKALFATLQGGLA